MRASPSRSVFENAPGATCSKNPNVRGLPIAARVSNTAAYPRNRSTAGIDGSAAGSDLISNLAVDDDKPRRSSVGTLRAITCVSPYRRLLDPATHPTHHDANWHTSHPIHGPVAHTCLGSSCTC